MPHNLSQPWYRVLFGLSNYILNNLIVVTGISDLITVWILEKTTRELIELILRHRNHYKWQPRVGARLSQSNSWHDRKYISISRLSPDVLLYSHQRVVGIPLL